MTATCVHCKREIALATLGIDLKGRQVLVWHYVDPNATYPTPLVYCPGSGHAPPPDIYHSNYGAADLIPNKIVKETDHALMRHAVMWEHVNRPHVCFVRDGDRLFLGNGHVVRVIDEVGGETTGKQTEGSES